MNYDTNPDARFNVIKMANGKETVPEYLKDIPLKSIYAYFFNWHPHQETANLSDIELWYQTVRGWTWEAV